MKISQSLMKEFRKYMFAKGDYESYAKKGLDNIPSNKITDGNYCGLLFKAKYIDKSIFLEPSDSMKEGIYFEYLATGVVPRSGIVPEPEKTLKGEPIAAYKKTIAAAKFFKSIIEHYKIKILEVGHRLETEDAVAVLDILAEWNGKPCIIDLKYTGLFNDKWSDLGWNNENIHLKENIMIQGLHFQYVAREVMEDMPFYYFVFNSKDSGEMKIIKQVNDEDQFEQHRADILYVKELLQKEIENGFMALPYYKNCNSCPLKENCTEKEEFPKIITISYSGTT